MQNEQVVNLQHPSAGAQSRASDLPFNVSAIPTEIKEAPNWVVWRFEARNGDKPTKMPYNPATGKKASSTNPAEWSTIDVAVAAYRANPKKYSGIGFVFAPPFCGVDMDHVIDPDTGEVLDWAVDAVARIGSYTETSPSGTGLHIIAKAKLPGGGHNDQKAGREMYDSGRYFTMTGKRWPGTPSTVEARQDAIESLYKEWWPKPKPQQQPADERPAEPVNLDDRAIIEKACSSKNGATFDRLWRGDASGYSSQSEADQALCNRLAFWTNRDAERIDRLFRQSGLMRPKWDTKRGDTTYGQQTIDKAVGSTREGYSGRTKTRTNLNPASNLAASKAVIEAAIEAAKDDDGAPFETDVIEALAIIQSASMADYKRLRGRFKAAGVGVGELDRAIKTVINQAKPADSKSQFKPAEIKPANLPAAPTTDPADPWPVIEPDARAQWPNSDVANGLRLARQLGRDLLHVHGVGWHVWGGKNWRADEVGAVKHASRLGRLIAAEVSGLSRQMAASESDRERKDLGDQIEVLARWSKESEKRAKISDALALAKPYLHRWADAADSDHWLLCCKNGVLDLRTGDLRPHRRSDFITRVLHVDYDPAAPCSAWLAFLERVFDGNAELIQFVQKAVGYALTGDTREQCVFFLHGKGSNGKSTLLGALQELLGPYAKEAAPDLLMASKNERHPTEIADLKGARLVVAIETEENRRLRESLIKKMSGGDRMKGRYMGKDFFEFMPTHKVFLATNHKPVIRGTDHAIWRRIRLIPFDVTFSEEDKDESMPEKLRAELAGILAWAVEGCRLWQTEGLKPPQVVVKATDEYRVKMDLLADFLEECCIQQMNAKVKASELYEAYSRWCDANGERRDSQKVFSERLAERGFEKKRSGGIKWQGIGLLSEPQNMDLEGLEGLEGICLKNPHEEQKYPTNRDFCSNPSNPSISTPSSEDPPSSNAPPSNGPPPSNGVASGGVGGGNRPDGDREVFEV